MTTRRRTRGSASRRRRSPSRRRRGWAVPAGVRDPTPPARRVVPPRRVGRVRRQDQPSRAGRAAAAADDRPDDERHPYERGSRSNRRATARRPAIRSPHRGAPAGSPRPTASYPRVGPVRARSPRRVPAGRHGLHPLPREAPGEARRRSRPRARCAPTPSSVTDRAAPASGAPPLCVGGTPVPGPRPGIPGRRRACDDGSVTTGAAARRGPGDQVEPPDPCHRCLRRPARRGRRRRGRRVADAPGRAGAAVRVVLTVLCALGGAGVARRGGLWRSVRWSRPGPGARSTTSTGCGTAGSSRSGSRWPWCSRRSGAGVRLGARPARHRPGRGRGGVARGRR